MCHCSYCFPEIICFNIYTLIKFLLFKWCHTHYGLGVWHMPSTMYWSLIPELVIWHGPEVPDPVLLIVRGSQQSASTATPTLSNFWKSNGNHTSITTWYSQLIQPDKAGETTWQSQKVFSPSCRTHQVTSVSKSQISGLLLKMSPCPACLLPGASSTGLAFVIYSDPFAFSGTGEGGVTFTGDILDSTNKLSTLVSFHCLLIIVSMKGEYTGVKHVFMLQLRGIVLISCQLLCLWKSVLFLHDLELLVLAQRTTNLSRYLASSHH